MIKVIVDLTRCQGYGNCVSAAPRLFDINDDGQSYLLVDDLTQEHLGELRAAASVCPVSAIAVVTST